MAHPIEPRFTPDEALVRRVRSDDVDRDGHLKRRALRPQVSVFRNLMGGASAALKLPGDHLAIVTVGRARTVAVGAVNTVVLHDPTPDNPTPDNPSHAILAMHTLAPPDVDLLDDRETWRFELARAFSVLR